MVEAASLGGRVPLSASGHADLLGAASHGWRLAFEHSPIGIALLDTDGVIALANARLAELLERSAPTLVGCRLADLASTDDGEEDLAGWSDLLSGRRKASTAERRYVTGTGEVLWVQLTLAGLPDVDGIVRGVTAQLQDVTRERESELALAGRSMNDDLTGLPNRWMTREWLQRALEEQPAEQVGVLSCDLDRFKLVNDSLGHPAGDTVLVEVADRLRSALRPEEFAGRVGGDEFVVVAEGVRSTADLLEVAGRVAAVMQRPMALGGHLHTATMSIGVALGVAGDNADDVLLRSGMALLRAKANGRACVELFDAVADRPATAADLELQEQLRLSVAAGDLRAYYQPIVRLSDQRLAGYEALVRWAHAERGLLVPDLFLGIAEGSGLIAPIGSWMLERACEDAAALLPQDLWVGVNASPLQLARTGFVDLLTQTLARSRLAPDRLHLEITESALLAASPALVRDMRRLDEMGVSIALDDFGTGFSSLSLLRDLPVSVVKIDRSFVAPLLTDPGSLATVRAVIGLCNDLGLDTVAEGVETREQADLLTHLGCAHAQGFLYGRPGLLPSGVTDPLRAGLPCPVHVPA